MKIKVIAVCIGLMIGSVINAEVMAEGGKIKANNPLYDDEGNVVGVVHTYDSEECTITAIDHSGKNLYVICEED